jgi:hypothetical protein
MTSCAIPELKVKATKYSPPRKMWGSALKKYLDRGRRPWLSGRTKLGSPFTANWEGIRLRQAFGKEQAPKGAKEKLEEVRSDFTRFVRFGLPDG